jgi:hypothetical protein
LLIGASGEAPDSVVPKQIVSLVQKFMKRTGLSCRSFFSFNAPSSAPVRLAKRGRKNNEKWHHPAVEGKGLAV